MTEPKVELYNVAKDIGEQYDLAKAQPELTQRLLNKLNRWIEESGQPIPAKNPNYDPDRVYERTDRPEGT